MRRLLTTGLVLATLATVLMAAPAQAHEQYTNGCSVPGLPQGGGDRGFGFDFHAACDAHDLCYVYHAAGEYEPGRKACDDMFFYLMRQSVWRMPWWNWHPDAGMVMATSYYWAVRAGGFKPFYDNWRPARANVMVRR
jgi:hypothetical protein